jgi:hypothetical protein
LTERQAEVLRCIQDYIARHGFPPSGRELARACRLGSPSGAHRMLVVLENKGYLTRERGLSRGLSVAARPVEHGELTQEDHFALLTIISWLAMARDAELMMAARQEDFEAKAVLIETARERHQEFCRLQGAIEGLGGIPFPDPRDFSLQYDLLKTLPRCESWELFVIDTLVCNRIFSSIAQYISTKRPAVRGLLWRQEQFSEYALARSQRWACELLESLPSQNEFDFLSGRATALAGEIYRTAKEFDSWSDNGLLLLSPGINPEEAAALITSPSKSAVSLH